MRSLIGGLGNSWVSQLMTPALLVFFLGLIYWVYCKSRAKIYEEIQNFPLIDED